MNCRVVIVDDDEDDIEILCEAFGDNGLYDCHFALSATEALTYLESITDNSLLPNIVITDFMLPGVSGAELLGKLKQTDRFKQIVVVVLSNYPAEDSMKKSDAPGADRYYRKPTTYHGFREMTGQIIREFLPNT